MANGLQASFDTSGWSAGLDRLLGPARVSLARSMAVAGGEVLRDEAKARVNTHNGVLGAAIYLAFRERYSTDQEVQYAVTWNKSKAPHGHLVEFGHWQIYAVIRKPDGTYVTDKRRKRASPKWVPAYPFLRPAFDAANGRARLAMIQRGRERLPELLAAQEVGNAA
ncbi:HK97 gp10 family phage protein [Achromobacter aegrifaciens]|uniref:HK97 gp10 family phage protein n=1 Tax=Achromobacter aegrifaciens TaxID=1287736 RepID=UPI000F740CC7|nr:HK97 gp10 family phage protein [Achromobacter aegrifaciens]RSF08807.1 HK97 gp10 family phage protein [Achromobacter aegrifaciens]